MIPSIHAKREKAGSTPPFLLPSVFWLMPDLLLQDVAFAGDVKDVLQRRMTHGDPRVVDDQVLLRHIGHVLRVIILGQQMVERLVARGTHLGRNGLVPLLGVRKFRINVEDDAPEGVILRMTVGFSTASA